MNDVQTRVESIYVTGGAIVSKYRLSFLLNPDIAHVSPDISIILRATVSRALHLGVVSSIRRTMHTEIYSHPLVNWNVT